MLLITSLITTHDPPSGGLIEGRDLGFTVSDLKRFWDSGIRGKESEWEVGGLYAWLHEV